MNASIIRPAFKFPGIAVLFFLTSIPAFSQQLISAKAGSIQFLQGEVFLDGKLLLSKDGLYIQMENDQVLTTGKGYVEILLAPFTYLRLGENASLRMRQNILANIQLELSHGSAMIEVLEKIKTDPICIHISDSFIEIKKDGLYRLDAESRRLRVYSGDATAIVGLEKIHIKKSRTVVLDGALKPEKFDVEDADKLHQWAAQRSFALYARNLFFTKPLNTRYLSWRSKSEGIYSSIYRVTVKANEDWRRYWSGLWSALRRQAEKRNRQLMSNPRSIQVPYSGPVPTVDQR